jgi:hypothetical protein
MATTWRVYGAETLAYRLDRAELPGFFLRKNVVIGPGEGAIVIRDGQTQELVTESRVKVQGFWEGLTNKMLGWINGPHDVQIIFVNLGPMRIPIYLGEMQKREQTSTAVAAAGGWQFMTSATEVAIQALTADKQVVSAECILTLQVDPENPTGVISLMRSPAGLATPPPLPGGAPQAPQGRRAVSRMELAALVRDELISRVLIPHISSRRADELRGNRDLATSITSWARPELETSLRPWGLKLVDFVINWGLTEQEKADIARGRGELEEESRKFAHGIRLAQMSRDLEVDKTRIDNLQQLRLAETTNNEQLRDLCLTGVIRREALRDGQRISIVKVDAEVRVIQLEVQKQESTFRLETRRSDEMLRLDVEERSWRQKNEQRLAGINAEDKEMRNLVAAQIQMATAKHERETATRRLELESDFRRLQTEIEARYQERQARLQEDLARMDQVKTVLTAGLSGGVVTGDVLNTFLTENTKQSFGTTTDAKAAAVFEAEKSRNDMGTYRLAEDRERQHQHETTRLAANLMESSKQTPGPAIVTGIGPSMPQAPTMNVVSVPGGAARKALPEGPAAVAANDLAARLSKLKGLHQQGLIDDDEYKQRKAAILAEV